MLQFTVSNAGEVSVSPPLAPASTSTGAFSYLDSHATWGSRTVHSFAVPVGPFAALRLGGGDMEGANSTLLSADTW